MFEILVSYLEKAIFAKKEFFLVTDLNTSFHHLLTKFGEEDFDTVGLTTQKLEEELWKPYGDKIGITSGRTKAI